MQVNADRLEERLADRGLEKFYFFYGEEPLQALECAGAVRHQAISEQVTERVIFDVNVGIDWQVLLDGNKEMSLFSSRRLVEIRLGNRKPDKKGAGVLEQLITSEQTEDVLLVSADGLDSKARKTKWFKALERHAVCVMTRSLKQNALRNWLNKRAETIRGDKNPYDAWIAMYESDEFQQAMHAEIQWLDERLADVSPARFEQLTRIFSDATRLEIDFWEMGLKQSD